MYRLSPKLGLIAIAIAYTFISILVYDHTCIREHRHWFIRVKHLSAADKVPMFSDALDL
jgi:hypothetical protein